MKRAVILLATAVALAVPAIAKAQVAGSTLIGVAAAELRTVAVGWSARHQVLGQPVFNDKAERIGAIDDVVISPDKSVSYAIINAGGFLGVDKHDVAIPVGQLQLVDNKLILAGATRDALRASPAFEYATK